MVLSGGVGTRIFRVCNHIFLIALALLCILPLVQVLAMSFSASSAVAAGLVRLWPVDFTLKSYVYILKNAQFLGSFGVTLQRVALGFLINMVLVVLTAYPLSKGVQAFRGRTLMVWLFVFTILFQGGLIPSYMTIRMTGIMDSVWALVLPGAVQVFNVILLLNFFRNLPKELEESAFIDGAGHWTIMSRIFVPLSLPAMATIMLFTIVGHWNSWFDGLIYMNKPEHYPLATYLQTLIIQMDFKNMRTEDAYLLAEISNRTSKAAQIIIGSLPILVVYPFLQRFFVKGIVLGSVKE
ncbi:carbohydrate ABC transporter permease [Cohnella sp. GbtcB17]|uniref:carbohydrate ABC transporter permease n=1 Tax=Cohnella sp. GbtcB17 TaxID=2824762 RepID=UPI001C301F43|nr:carbohydrate ABC transporter permease [Cohnella sp. GbtcB17]